MDSFCYRKKIYIYIYFVQEQYLCTSKLCIAHDCWWRKTFPVFSFFVFFISIDYFLNLLLNIYLCRNHILLYCFKVQNRICNSIFSSFYVILIKLFIYIMPHYCFAFLCVLWSCQIITFFGIICKISTFYIYYYVIKTYLLKTFLLLMLFLIL